MNGNAGSSGAFRRLEALQVQLIPKWSASPATGKAFLSASDFKPNYKPYYYSQWMECYRKGIDLIQTNTGWAVRLCANEPCHDFKRQLWYELDTCRRCSSYGLLVVVGSVGASGKGYYCDSKFYGSLVRSHYPRQLRNNAWRRRLSAYLVGKCRNWPCGCFFWQRQQNGSIRSF